MVVACIDIYAAIERNFYSSSEIEGDDDDDGAHEKVAAGADGKESIEKMLEDAEALGITALDQTRYSLFLACCRCRGDASL
jgi:hypothetical protein